MKREVQSANRTPLEDEIHKLGFRWKVLFRLGKIYHIKSTVAYDRLRQTDTLLARIILLWKADRFSAKSVRCFKMAGRVGKREVKLAGQQLTLLKNERRAV
jgi:hypothetical protein